MSFARFESNSSTLALASRSEAENCSHLEDDDDDDNDDVLDDDDDCRQSKKDYDGCNLMFNLREG